MQYMMRGFSWRCCCFFYSVLVSRESAEVDAASRNDISWLGNVVIM